MVQVKDRQMGRFSFDVELASYNDIVRAGAGDIPAESIRRLTLRGVVDTGATRLVIPESVAQALGLPITSSVTVRYADGHTGQRSSAEAIHLTYAGRSSVFNAVVEPDRDSALIGAIVLEDLDLLADCTHQSLAPRDPDRIISEIE